MSQLSQGEAYSLLGLPIGADRDAVKSSFKRLAQKSHPDKSQHSEESLLKFGNICRAYMRLTTDNENIIIDNKEMFELYNSVMHPKSQRMKAAIVKNELYNNCENGDSNKLRHCKNTLKNSTDNNSNLCSNTNFICNNDSQIFSNRNSFQTTNNCSSSQNNIITQYVNELSQSSMPTDAMILESRQLAIGGNALAMEGRHLDAVDNFTQAINLDPSDYRFYGNRSFCYERLEKYSQAFSDAVKAIHLQPEWAKGYFRKGKALAGLRNFAEAEEAFLEVLKLDAKCQDAKHELTRVREQQLIEMGFSSRLAAIAIGQCESVSIALESLLAGNFVDPSNDASQSDDDSKKASTKGAHKTIENSNHETNGSFSLGSSLSKSEHSIPNSVQDDNQIFTTQKNTKNSTQNISNQKAQNCKNHKTAIPPIPQHHYDLAQKQILLNNKQDVIKMNPRNPEGLTSLWVGNILPDVKQEELTKLFSKFGNLQSVKCMPEKFCAFINFANKDCAGKAMQTLQGADVHGQKLLIKFPDHPVPSIYQNGSEKTNKNPKDSNLKNGTTKVNLPSTSSNLLKQPQQQQQQQQTASTSSMQVDRTKGPVNGDECYFWRTTGCQFTGTCRYRHLPEHKGIDKKPWHKPGAK